MQKINGERGHGVRLFCLSAILPYVFVLPSGYSRDDEEITEVKALQNLPSLEARKNPRVRLRGVITYCDNNLFGFIQDRSGGVYFNPQEAVPDGGLPTLVEGMEVELSGKVEEGKFAPYVGHEVSAVILGEAPFPEPLRPDRGRLLQARLHSQWVEMETYIHSAEMVSFPQAPYCLELQMAFGNRNVIGYINGDWKEKEVPGGLVGSDVRIRGVYGSMFNEDNELDSVRIFIPTLKDIEVLDQDLEHAFSRWPRKSFEMMGFNQGRDERIRFKGVVLASIPG